MESLGYPQPIVIGVAPRQNSPQHNSSHIVADVVLLDKTNNCVQPKIYQLKEEEGRWQGGLVEINNDSFMLLGGYVYHNKQEKVLYYTNPYDENYEEKSIKYEHLIIVKGIGPSITNMEQIEEFCKGVQIMKEALELQKKVTPKLDVSAKLASLLKEQHPSVHFSKIDQSQKLTSVVSTLTDAPHQGSQKPIFDQDKRLFEII